jgi:trans-2-enoyl-CoA reductase
MGIRVMKQIQFNSFGRPEEVVEIVEMPDLAVSEGDDVLVRVQFAPVGPADIGTFWGRYPRQDPDSIVPGIEALGVVEAIGSAVSDLSIGDRVLVLPTHTWSEQLLLKRDQVVRVSNEGDIFQQFTLKSNGATAALLLSSIVDLQSGDWVVQNAANSTVGQYVVQIARARGIRTANIVRNEAVSEQLRSLGGDIVVIEGPDAASEILSKTGNVHAKLGIDRVAGAATALIADVVAEGGTVVVYGGLSGQPVQVHAIQLISLDVAVRAFWATKWLLRTPNAEVQSLITQLDGMASKRALVTEVSSRHKLSDIKTALRNASASGRNGKVVLDFRDD